MKKTEALQKLLNGTASEEDVELLKRLLANGDIAIGGNVNKSVIIGSGDTVELTLEALDRLNARTLLGNLDRDLTGEEIASGLQWLERLLPNRAPVLIPRYMKLAARLRSTLNIEVKLFSETTRRERLEALASINSICVEVLDVSFNGLCLGEESPQYDARSPFRGLESFRPEDSEFFFGREALTQKLVGKIKAHSFLAVLGASGSGKSSLVMAGVIPALASDYVIFRPGTNPLGELASAHGKSLIVVDQFEELFTLTRDESTRKDFIARLLDEATRTRIILTLRSDFLGEVGAYRTLSAEIQNHLEIVPPMDMEELRHAVEGQAGVVGLRFEADLSQQILDDVEGEPGAMPLLQHALWELWNRRHGRNLTASEYRAFGGVKQAIASTAEAIYSSCSKTEQEQMRDIFLRLTLLDDRDDGRDMRRRIPQGDLIPTGPNAASTTLLLNKLADARLIVKTVNEDTAEVEVAHEALIRNWERLRLWLNEDRDNLRLRESLIENARQWERSGRKDDFLNHRGGRLDDALSLRNNSYYALALIENSYLDACVALRSREYRRRVFIRRIGVFVIVVAIIPYLYLTINSRSLASQGAIFESTKGAFEKTVIAVTAQFNENTPECACTIIDANQTPTLAMYNKPASSTAGDTGSANLEKTPKITETPSGVTTQNAVLATHTPEIVSPVNNDDQSITGFLLPQLSTYFPTLLLGLLFGLLAIILGASKKARAIISISWLTSIGTRLSTVAPGIVRGLLFKGYTNRLLCQPDVEYAKDHFFGIPAFGSREGHIIPDENGDNLITHISQTLRSNRSVMITGKGGAGKTTLLARFAYLAMLNKLPEFLNGYIPIFLSIGYYEHNLPEAIAKVLKERDGLNVNVEIIKAQLESGKFLILIDGVSEIEGDVEKEIKSILQKTQSLEFEKCRFIVSSRPIPSMDAALSPDVSVFELQPLTQNNILKLLPRYRSILGQEQEKRIKEKFLPLFVDNMEPLLFTMMLTFRGSTPTKAKLFENYFHKLLKLENKEIFKWLGWQVSLIELAKHFLIQTGFKGRGDFHEHLINILEKNEGGDNKNLISRLNEKYKLEIIDAYDLLNKLGSAGLLQFDRRWRFRHDTYEEFFTAYYIVDYLEKKHVWPNLDIWIDRPSSEKLFFNIIEFVNEMKNDCIEKGTLGLDLFKRSNLPVSWPESWKDCLSNKND